MIFKGSRYEKTRTIQLTDLQGPPYLKNCRAATLCSG